MNGAVPESETWFDRYIRDNGHDPGEPEPDLGVPSRPDRLLTWNGHAVVCEIKEFGQDVIPEGGGARTIGPDQWYGAVRRLVHAAARQMRDLHGCGVPLVAVLANPRDRFVPLNVDEVLNALYGNPQVVFRINRETGEMLRGRRTAGRPLQTPLRRPRASRSRPLRVCDPMA